MLHRSGYNITVQCAPPGEDNHCVPPYPRHDDSRKSDAIKNISIMDVENAFF